MKKIILTSILSLFAAAGIGLHAQSTGAVLIPVSPESASLAGSDLASYSGGFALRQNISAASFSETRFAAEASFGLWAPKGADNKTVNLGGFTKIGKRWTIGIDGSYLRDQQTVFSSANGAVLGSYTPQDFRFGAGASFLINENLSIGASAGMVRSLSGPDTSSTDVYGDINLTWRHGEWKAAAALCNIGAPMILKAAGSWSRGALSAGLEADYLFDGAFGAAAGVQYTFFEMLSLRGGYHYGTPGKGIPSFASLGAGLDFRGFTLNAAWLFASPTLTNTLLVGVGYSF